MNNEQRRIIQFNNIFVCEKRYNSINKIKID